MLCTEKALVSDTAVVPHSDDAAHLAFTVRSELDARKKDVTVASLDLWASEKKQWSSYSMTSTS